MHLSCHIGCLSDRPLAKAFRIILDAGYHAVELSWAEIRAHFGDAVNPASEIQAMLDANGLGLSGLAASDMNVVRADEQRSVVAAIEHQMDIAKSLGLSAVSLAAGDRKRQPWELLMAGLWALSAIAGERQMAIALSNREGSRIEQIEDLRAVVYGLADPQLRVINDTGQFHLASVNPCDVIREFADRTITVRIADCMGRRLVSLGRGETNVPAIVEHLHRRQYQGWFVVGPDVPDGVKVVKYLAESVSYLGGLGDRCASDKNPPMDPS